MLDIELSLYLQSSLKACKFLRLDTKFRNFLDFTRQKHPCKTSTSTLMIQNASGDQIVKTFYT